MSKIFPGVRNPLGSQSHICAKTLYWEGMEHIIERISIPKVMASAAILLRSISESSMTIVLKMTDVTMTQPYDIKTAWQAVSG